MTFQLADSRFVAQGVRYFLTQDYPNKELIIVDDGGEAVGDPVPVRMACEIFAYTPQ